MPESLSGESRLYPIIGDPIVYVKIPPLLTKDLALRGKNGICIPMQVPTPDLDVVMRGLTRTLNVDGLLVTMPHKSAAFAYCTTSSERAKLLGVVGAVRRNHDGTWHGEMFDGLAFVKAQTNKGAQPKGARVLLVGAGGAGSAIAIAFIESGVRELRIFDTDSARCAKLVELVLKLAPGRVIVSETADPTGCDIVSNATPLGMSPKDPIPVAAHLLKSSMFVGDVVAGHGVTPLLAAAQAAGCKTASGVDMVEAGRALMLEFFLEV